MSNFSFLLAIPEYSSFSKLCLDAELAIERPPFRICITECRVALEKCVKFVYTKENNLLLYDYSNMTLYDMIDNKEFQKIVPFCVLQEIQSIRRFANQGLHNGRDYNKDTAVNSLKSLFIFVQWIDKRYNHNYTERYFSQAELSMDNSTTDSPKTSNWAKVGYAALGSVLTLVGLAFLGNSDDKTKKY